MNPNRLDIEILRGSDFELELIAQVKTYLYDPLTDTAPSDIRRSHQENLDFYGHTYVYIDFLADYTPADCELVVRKGWLRQGADTSEPLLELGVGTGLTLTYKSVDIGLTATETAVLEFDSGTYELLVKHAATGKVSQLVYGKVTVTGEKE